MIQDVILDVKNKIKFSFFLLDFTIFLRFSFIYSTRLTSKKIKRGLRNLKEKNGKSSTETEREGFEPSVRITRTTD